MFILVDFNQVLLVKNADFVQFKEKGYLDIQGKISIYNPDD